MCAGAASSTVMQCFTVPLDIVGQARQEEIADTYIEGRALWQKRFRFGDRERAMRWSGQEVFDVAWVYVCRPMRERK